MLRSLDFINGHSTGQLVIVSNDHFGHGVKDTLERENLKQGVKTKDLSDKSELGQFQMIFKKRVIRDTR